MLYIINIKICLTIKKVQVLSMHTSISKWHKSQDETNKQKKKHTQTTVILMYDGQTWNNPAAYLANCSLRWITIDKTDAWDRCPRMDGQTNAHGTWTHRLDIWGQADMCTWWMDGMTDQPIHTQHEDIQTHGMNGYAHTHTHIEWTDIDLQDWWTDWCTKWTHWCTKWTDTWDTGTLTHRMDTPMDGWTDWCQKLTDI